MLVCSRPVPLAHTSGFAKRVQPTLGFRVRVFSPMRLQIARVVDSAGEGSNRQETADEPAKPVVMSEFQKQRLELKKQRVKDAMAYRFSAIAATVLVLSIAIVATFYRFHWHLAEEGDVPLDEVAATLLLVFGGIFGMEMYARFAHKVLWHDFEPGWALHKSHHEPRTGPFEANDIYAVANAVPAMVLCAYGFLTPHVVGGVCFGAGLGITLFGIMYMFFHDGLVHKRFPVGPIAEVPYMKRVLVAHQIHHTNKFNGVPFGMFLGPQELEAVPGGKEELERMLAALEAREAEARQAVAP
ncbi:hypothetical protein Vretimale_16337 [Volvox reticuliferus]|uniref:beta-carotene 3-hydroxylase n=1 Tax=Volvox reticuliferus TaxID=1737510 RepID=A0A8J4CWB9_9CHLO|nr:hypothetical protein Vretifemale_17850 [Volvox reticuliferus]GIM13147.1 hypothetical protein Vretimale_16337 [Volvox reticuliferus]